MAYRVVLTPRAEQDIREAYRYIYDRAPDAAVRWYSRLRLVIEKLGDLPAKYPLAPESEKLGYLLNQIHYGKRSGVYRVLFRRLEEQEEIHVVSVRHGARDEIEPTDLD